MPRSHPVVIGVCGRAGSGKSTLCDHLDDELFPDAYTVRWGFAHPGKHFLTDVLGVDHRLVWGTQEDKNLPTHLLWEDLPWYTCLPEPRPSGYMTGREAMQQWLQAMRKADPACFERAFHDEVDAEEADAVFVEDVRFPSEIEAIHEYERGLVIYLHPRLPSEDSHASENSLPLPDPETGEPYDIVVPPNMGREEVAKYVEGELRKRGVVK